MLALQKEELSGETRNYLHNVAKATGKPVMTVLRETAREAVECTRRVDTILAGREPYAQSAKDSVRGLMAMHTTCPRYRLTEMGLDEEHPLAPMEHRIGEFFTHLKK